MAYRNKRPIYLRATLIVLNRFIHHGSQFVKGHPTKIEFKRITQAREVHYASKTRLGSSSCDPELVGKPGSFRRSHFPNRNCLRVNWNFEPIADRINRIYVGFKAPVVPVL